MRNRPPDAWMQFRALSDQLYRTPDEHGYIRAAAIAQLRSYPNLYCEYIPEDYQQYCHHMGQFGTWGDHVTLQAVADTFGVRIAIMTSYQDSCVVEIQPQGPVHSQRVLYLSFWAEVSVFWVLLVTKLLDTGHVHFVHVHSIPFLHML